MPPSRPPRMAPTMAVWVFSSWQLEVAGGMGVGLEDASSWSGLLVAGVEAGAGIWRVALRGDVTRGAVGLLQQLLVELAARQQYSPESQVWSCHAVIVDALFELLEPVSLLELLLLLNMFVSFRKDIPPEHCCGHATSFPVESVQPLENMTPIEAP